MTTAMEAFIKTHKETTNFLLQMSFSTNYNDFILLIQFSSYDSDSGPGSGSVTFI